MHQIGQRETWRGDVSLEETADMELDPEDAKLLDPVGQEEITKWIINGPLKGVNLVFSYWFLRSRLMQEKKNTKHKMNNKQHTSEGGNYK